LMVKRRGKRLWLCMGKIIAAGQIAAAGTALVEEIRASKPRELVIDLCDVEALELGEVEAIIDLMTIAQVLEVKPSIENIGDKLSASLRETGVAFDHAVK
jgi:anti-anti-sigma regulatory factor